MVDTKNIVKIVIDDIFGKTSGTAKIVSDGITLTPIEPVHINWEEKSEETTQKKGTDAAAEEWIWVTGYKGMNKDMQCRGGFQYELGKRYDMPEDVEIVVCDSGYHLCMNMKDVFGYVSIGSGNRFFEVRALVRKTDADEYGKTKRDSSNFWSIPTRIDKLAAKSIEIVRELSVDEIIEYVPDAMTWSDEYKKVAITMGLDAVYTLIKLKKLKELGYSDSFARWLVNNQKYDIAEAVGSQEGLSMDTKVFCIMNK